VERVGVLPGCPDDHRVLDDCRRDDRGRKQPPRHDPTRL